MAANTTYAFRLKPGQDLKQEIQKLVNEKQIKAGNRRMKIELIEKMNPGWNDLYESMISTWN